MGHTTIWVCTPWGPRFGTRETRAVKEERAQNAKKTPLNSRTPLAKITKRRKKEEENRQRTFGCTAVVLKDGYRTRAFPNLANQNVGSVASFFFNFFIMFFLHYDSKLLYIFFFYRYSPDRSIHTKQKIYNSYLTYKVHYITLQRLHNLFNLKLKLELKIKSNFGNLRRTRFR